MIKNWICSLPWTDVGTNMDGKYLICPFGTPSPHYINEMTPHEFFETDYVETVRRDMMNNDFSEAIGQHCKVCINLEKNGWISARRHVDDRPFDGFPQEIVPKEKLKKKLKAIMIYHLGNRCNLSCITCSPRLSTGFGSPLLDPWTEMKFDDKVLDDIKDIRFHGGEPLLSPHVKEQILKRPDTKFSLTTNGTVFPRWLKNHKRDKKAGLNIWISVDGVGPLDDYIRRGSQWKKKIENMHLFFKHCYTDILFTVNMVNYKGINDLKRFMKDEFGYDLTRCNRVTSPAYLDAINLPIWFKKKHTRPDQFQDLKNQHTFKIDQPNEQKFREGVSYCKTMDAKYGINFLNHMPEFEELYNEVDVNEFDVEESIIHEGFGTHSNEGGFEGWLYI
tara:strand:- start:2205 stop:3374 length:1170 start_codon:yes stop_codon:yes gene_type:complete